MDDILGMNEAQRTELKWRFLMERYRVYFKVNLGIDNSSSIQEMSCKSSCKSTLVLISAVVQYNGCVRQET